MTTNALEKITQEISLSPSISTKLPITNNSHHPTKMTSQFDDYLFKMMVKSENINQHFTDKNRVFSNQNNISKLPGFSDKLVNKLSLNLTSSSISFSSEALTSTPPITAIETNPTPNKNSTLPIGQDFIKFIWPIAQQVARLIGLDPKLLVAQAALETGWGQFVAKDAVGDSSYNLFNIKALADTRAPAVHSKTTEFIADKPVKITAAFKKYPSIAASFHDYIRLIATNPRYQQALACTRDTERYVNELQAAGYATDPNYAAKLLSIYYGAPLQQALS